MALSCPWNVAVASAPTASTAHSNDRKPTLQEIMDEEFARQLYDDECRSLQELSSDEQTLASFTGLEDKADGRELLGADSFSFDSNDGDTEQPTVTIPTVPANKSTRKQRFDRSIPVEGTNQGLNSIRESFRRWDKDQRHGHSGGRVEAARFATQDAVLDMRTTLLLQKLINRGDLDEVHGCLQSGKEANVYFAMATDPDTFKRRAYAIKIFKTTLNAFSNRHEYITGDRRYDLAFQKKDRRRQIHEWSEKEFRNLARAVKWIRAPEPILVKEHIVVMSFVGDTLQGLPAPTLKEVAASLTPNQMLHAYADLMVATRALFHQAKLVHGDLSEYNVLYQRQQCWLIDFGQAMDQTHPEFLSFLRRDLVNVRQFFAKQGLVGATVERESEDGQIGLLSVDEALEWVTALRKDQAEDVTAKYPLLQKLLQSKA